jgi:glycosyltransferase involved in cell wall biosynthesis
MRLLMFTDWYSPGFKAGGPIRSCVNFAHYMKDSVELYIFTGDRDLGDKSAYHDIQRNTWIELDGIHIYYASPRNLDWKNILRTIRGILPDFIYLNSMFSRYFSIYPVLMKRSGLIKYPIVISPRGMLRESALQFKSGKKRLFLTVFKSIGISKLLHFHATDVTEVNDIRKNFGNDIPVTLISNFPGIQKIFVPPVGKIRGNLKLIYIGRIHPIKNLLFLLECLKNIRSKLKLTIVAAFEKEDYWEKCKKAMHQLPSHVSVQVLSNVEHEKLEEIIRQHHLFFLPTQGENFGHSIFESLAAGRPVLVSDQTPWRDLEKRKSGWDLPLDNQLQFRKVIDEVAQMNNEELTTWCEGAWEHARNFIHHSDLKQQYLKLFS